MAQVTADSIRNRMGAGQSRRDPFSSISISQVVKFGQQPLQFSIGPQYFGDDGPEWGIGFTVAFLFPK
jgi:hypothetical protein